MTKAVAYYRSSLNTCWLAQDPVKAWVTLSPARAIDQAAPGTRPKDTP